MWWLLLIPAGIVALVLLVIAFAGNWRATLNKVITMYIAWKQMEPGYSDKEIFMAVLDHRYPEPKKDVGGILKKQFIRKNGVKEEIEYEVESKMSVIDKYSLPILVYACLVIEENTYLNSKKFTCVEEQLEPITEEVKRQGFAKYC